MAKYKLEVKNELGQVVCRKDLNEFTGTCKQLVDISKYGKWTNFVSLSDTRR